MILSKQNNLKKKSLFILFFVGIQSFSQTNIKFKDVTNSHLPPITQSISNSMDANVSDLDNDGDLDIVIAVEFKKNIILINDGNGKFNDCSYMLPDLENNIIPKPYPYYPYHDSEDIAIADFNNDGFKDIIIVTEDDLTNEYYLNVEGKSFKNMTNKLPVKGISNAVISADFDNDGWKDLIIGNNGQNNYLKNDKGQFIDETSIRLPNYIDITQDLEAGDYDNDGDLDILIGNEDKNRLLENDGDGKFTDVTNLVFKNGGINEETREADFGDIDNDKDLDIFFANVTMFTKNAPIQRILINEDKKFIEDTNAKIKFITNQSYIDIDFIDLNNDQFLDIILAGVNGIKIFLNDKTGSYNDFTEELILSSTNRLAVDCEIHDFNGDGILDIFVANFRAEDFLLFGY